MSNEQLLLELEGSKTKPEKKKAKEKFCIGDEIRIIKLRPESKKALSYYQRDIGRRKGKIVNLLGTERDPSQGVRVKFGKRGFEYAFHPDEIRKIKKK